MVQFLAGADSSGQVGALFLPLHLLSSAVGFPSTDFRLDVWQCSFEAAKTESKNHLFAHKILCVSELKDSGDLVHQHICSGLGGVLGVREEGSGQPHSQP